MRARGARGLDAAMRRLAARHAEVDDLHRRTGWSTYRSAPARKALPALDRELRGRPC